MHNVQVEEKEDKHKTMHAMNQMAALWWRAVKIIYAENAESSPPEQASRHRLLSHVAYALSGLKGIMFPLMSQNDNGIQTRHGEWKGQPPIHDYGVDR